MDNLRTGKEITCTVSVEVPYTKTYAIRSMSLDREDLEVIMDLLDEHHRDIISTEYTCKALSEIESPIAKDAERMVSLGLGNMAMITIYGLMGLVN